MAILWHFMRDESMLGSGQRLKKRLSMCSGDLREVK